MPNLTLSVTSAQAARIQAALAALYKGTPRENDVQAAQVANYLMSALRHLVREYEQQLAVQSLPPIEDL